MNDKSAFESERDPELGALLQEAFTGPAPERFLARIRGAVGGLPARQSEWDVLAAWSGPRVLMAAAAAGFLLGVTLWRGWQDRVAPSVVASASVPVEILEPVRSDEPILYAVLEAR